MLKLNLNLKGLEKGQKLTIDNAKKVLMKSMFKMEELAIEKAPFDRGYLRENITVFPEVLADKYVLTSKAGYSEDLEYGNTPRDVKIDVLEAWVERKGIRTGENVFAFAKYVQEKIKMKGVNAQPFMRPALYEVENFWLPQFKTTEFK